jgi:predicted lipid-binding transport protein (Tim44 family)
MVPSAHYSSMSSMPSMPTPAPIGLYAEATRAAWRQLGWSTLGFVGGIVLTLVGLVTGIIAVIGLILTVGCLVAIPMSIARILDPTREGSLVDLGATTTDRQIALANLDAEITHPSTWRLPAKDGTLYIAGRALVYVGPSAVEAAPAWTLRGFWTKPARGGKVLLCFQTATGRVTEVEVQPFEVPQTLHALSLVYRHAQFA